MRVAARAAASAASLAWGAVSMTASFAPALRAASRTGASLGAWALKTAGEEFLRRAPQVAAEACGSMSTMAAGMPARSAATASAHASAVLPVPPFIARTASVSMSGC